MSSTLPFILAGPILRHCDTGHFTLWFVSREPLSDLTLHLGDKVYPLCAAPNTPQSSEPQTTPNTERSKSDRHNDKQAADNAEPDTHVHIVPLGKHAYQYLIRATADDLLAPDTEIDYQIFALRGQQQCDIFAEVDALTYAGKSTPNVCVMPTLHHVLHGSCRNPHHHSADALVAADQHLADIFARDPACDTRPALLMMSGDQVYVDDVAGPMLYAIGQVIELLGLEAEDFTDAAINSSQELSYHVADLYQRHKNLLPRTQYPARTALLRWYRNHPIFTSSIAENHLVSLSEIIALYLLTWSPELWKLLDLPAQPQELSPERMPRWQKEHQHLQEFVAGLKQVRRLQAHIPTYMMFDDHDITDDWNLTAKWELAAYGHPFSKQIIGNALIGYTLFQGLGNAPTKFDAVIRPQLDQFFRQRRSEDHQALIESLLHFEQWHYTLNTSPKFVVLDTRTRRWRSESNLAKPSGLMDWEALMDLQQELIDQTKVIIVSPAPMFGVKLIEAIQRSATFIGASLLVDAENWMAHPGAANTLLSIFLHRKTPEQFIILSGDVHYSFSYDIRIRFRRGSPHIYQITCSGIKNQFPEKLLPWFEKLNGWLYGHFSPLNLLTKRKRMLIRGRRPNGERSKRLVNNSGIGMLAVADDGAPTQISVLHADMTVTHFDPPKSEEEHRGIASAKPQN